MGLPVEDQAPPSGSLYPIREVWKEPWYDKSRAVRSIARKDGWPWIHESVFGGRQMPDICPFGSTPNQIPFYDGAMDSLIQRRPRFYIENVCFFLNIRISLSYPWELLDPVPRRIIASTIHISPTDV